MSFFSKFVRLKIERAQHHEPDHEFQDKVERAAEYPDPTPMAPPIGYKKVPSIWEQQKALIRAARLEEHEAGMETFEEADDFDVDDDFEPSTPFEAGFDYPTEPPPTPQAAPPEAGPPPQPVPPAAPPAPPSAAPVTAPKAP